MPQIIQYIDAIAREKQRDVLLIKFSPAKSGKSDDDYLEARIEYDHNEDERRTEVLQWLDDHCIPWQKCGPFVSEGCLLGYEGDVYLDLPYDENNGQYQLVRDYLENPDESMRDERVTWHYLPLENAMKNAYQDEPGYWDRFWDGGEEG